MATSKLALYNGALLLLGERRLASLGESREPRRALDDVWDQGAVKHCLEQGAWSFAVRSTALDHDPGVDPAFGYAYAFAQPTDFARLAGISDNETFAGDFDDYQPEAGYWFANVTPLYLRFVSTDANYGGDLSLWPETFIRFVESYLAARIAARLTASASKAEAVEKKYNKLKSDAQGKDAVGRPTSYPPHGGWAKARHGGGPRGDGGARGRLIG